MNVSSKWKKVHSILQVNLPLEAKKIRDGKLTVEKMTFQTVFERKNGRWLWIHYIRVLQARRDTRRCQVPEKGQLAEAARWRGRGRFSAVPHPDSKGQPEPPTFKVIGWMSIKKSLSLHQARGSVLSPIWNPAPEYTDIKRFNSQTCDMKQSSPSGVMCEQQLLHAIWKQRSVYSLKVENLKNTMYNICIIGLLSTSFSSSSLKFALFIPPSPPFLSLTIASSILLGKH